MKPSILRTLVFSGSLTVASPLAAHIEAAADAASWTSTASAAAKPPSNQTKCTISPSAPSLAPAALYGGAVAAPAGTYSRVAGRNVSISERNSTVFGFSVPATFGAGRRGTGTGTTTTMTMTTCALQFRFPYCDDLPLGYPCFRWSGLEQMVLGRSGMRFSTVSMVRNGPAGRTGGVVKAPAWEDAVEGGEVRVAPPGNVTVGTFACGGGGGEGYGDREYAWLGESFNGWQLEFVQGGGAGSEGGVGLFVVPCS